MAEGEVPCKRQKQLEESDEWRKSAPNLIHLLKIMLEEDIETDVTIEITSECEYKEIECHKLILSAHSPVLRTMLSDRWAEEVIKKRQIVTCIDDNPDHFHHFVKMMYWDSDSNKLDNYDIPDGITPEIAVGVLSLAHKYLAYLIIRQAEHLIISYLSKKCANQTVKLLTLLNCLPICKEGEVARPIYRTVLRGLLADGEAIFSSDAVLEFNGVVLADIVRRNDLRCPERIIYNGCYKWGQEQCNLKELPPTGENVRSVLGQTIMAIRFPLLDKLVITQEVLPSNILTDKEKADLLAYIINTQWAGLKTPSIQFCADKRLETCAIKRLDIKCLSKDLVDFSTTHGFTMSLSKKMTLYALFLFAGDISVEEYRARVEFKFVGKTLSFDRQIKNSDYLSRKAFSISTNVPIPANTPVNVEFTITGGPTLVSAERVEEMSKEITYWANEALIITFNASPNIPNGLKQIPILMFRSPEETSNSNADRSV